LLPTFGRALYKPGNFVLSFSVDTFRGGNLHVLASYSQLHVYRFFWYSWG